MNYTYNAASDGNTVQTGLLDLSNGGTVDLSSATSTTFNLVLSFGQSSNGSDAISSAEETLQATLHDRSNMLATYVAQWNSFDDSLHTPPAVGSTTTIQQARQQEYYLAANVLKASQDKQTGAFVAGLGTPWGESNGDQDSGGYHLVWERDMYEFSSALIVAGDTADPKRRCCGPLRSNKRRADFSHKTATSMAHHTLVAYRWTSKPSPSCWPGNWASPICGIIFTTSNPPPISLSNQAA